MNPTALRRELGLLGAVVTGLGSILGTGVFVSLALAAGAAGPSVVLATALAAAVALCNGLSSAQLAASLPVSGGTYEYGRTYLNETLGFTAGWMFLCAKSASAATAALGFAGYALGAFGVESPGAVPALGCAGALAVTAVVLGGARRTAAANAAILALSVGALLLFSALGLPRARPESLAPLVPSADALPGFLEATALLFVAYTGYGRIATMGEEVRDPARTIPRAIVLTLLASLALYLLVSVAAIGAAGADAFAAAAREGAAPLERIAEGFGVPGAPRALAVGAVAAMLGVLLNLVLGLSRVLLAMGRRGDAPAIFARIDASGATPGPAVVAVGLVVALLALLGSVKANWSFSAFTVLVYYAITNAAALRLPREHRRFPRALAWAGLAACLGLAFWVETRAWIAGLATIAAGLLWRAAFRRRGR